MIEQVTKDRVTYQRIPQKFEAGTPAIAEAIGLGSAVEYLTRMGWAAIVEHDQMLTESALKCLPTIPGLQLIGLNSLQARLPIFSFNLPGIHAHDVASLLDEKKIAIRAGHQCTQPLMTALGVPGTARASFGLSNTPDDVVALTRALREVQDVFR